MPRQAFYTKILLSHLSGIFCKTYAFGATSFPTPQNKTEFAGDIKQKTERRTFGFFAD